MGVFLASVERWQSIAALCSFFDIDLDLGLEDSGGVSYQGYLR